MPHLSVCWLKMRSMSDDILTNIYMVDGVRNNMDAILIGDKDEHSRLLLHMVVLGQMDVNNIILQTYQA